MLEQGKIDSKQAVILMMNLVLPTALITIPAISVQYAAQDAWLSIIIATAAGLIIALLIVNLSLKFPGKTLFEYPEDILGKTMGKIIGFLYIWTFFLYIGSGVVAEFGYFLNITLMPDTPAVVFCIIVVALAGFAVRNGLEVLSRFSQVFLLVVALLVIIFLFSIKDMKLARVLPFFDAGLIPIVKGAFLPASWLGEIIILGVITPYLSKPGDAYRVGVISIVIDGSFIAVSTMVVLLILGPNNTGSCLYPTFMAVRAISIGNFLERLESVVIMLWILGGIAKVGLFYYAAVLGSAQCLGLKDYKPLVLPVGVIMVAIIALYFGTNVIETFHYISLAATPYVLVFPQFGIPLLLLIVAWLRGKRGRNIK